MGERNSRRLLKQDYEGHVCFYDLQRCSSGCVVSAEVERQRMLILGSASQVEAP